MMGSDCFIAHISLKRINLSKKGKKYINTDPFNNNCKATGNCHIHNALGCPKFITSPFFKTILQPSYQQQPPSNILLKLVHQRNWYNVLMMSNRIELTYIVLQAMYFILSCSASFYFTISTGQGGEILYTF